MSDRPQLDEFVERARGAWRQAELDDAAAEAIAALASRGIESLLLKGPVLARQLYTPNEIRGYSDIDLFVAPSALDAARRTLAELDYGRGTDVLGIDDVSGVLHAETWSRHVARRRGGPLLVDLHWRLPGCAAAGDDVWAALASRRSSIELAGREVSVPDRVGLALHLALHAAQHGPADRKAIADLERGLDRWPTEIWRSAVTLAGEVRGGDTFAAGLRLAPAGAHLADRLGLPPTERVMWEILNRDARPRGTFHLEAFLRGRGWRERADVLRRSLIPTHEWIGWQYRWAGSRSPGVWLGYAAHLARAPIWAARAWWYARRAHRASGRPR